MTEGRFESAGADFGFELVKEATGPISVDRPGERPKFITGSANPLSGRCN